MAFPSDEYQSSPRVPFGTSSLSEFSGEPRETPTKSELPMSTAETSTASLATQPQESSTAHGVDDAQQAQGTRSAWVRRNSASQQRNYVLSFAKEADLKDVVCHRSKPHMSAPCKKKSAGGRTKRQEYISALEKSFMQHARELDALREQLAVAQQENAAMKSQLLLASRQQCVSTVSTLTVSDDKWCQ